MDKSMATLARVYEAELHKYRKHHVSKSNVLLHAVLTPVEWCAALCLLGAVCNSAAVCALQSVVVAGAVAATRRQRPLAALAQLSLIHI